MGLEEVVVGVSFIETGVLVIGWEWVGGDNAIVWSTKSETA